MLHVPAVETTCCVLGRAPQRGLTTSCLERAVTNQKQKRGGDL